MFHEHAPERNKESILSSLKNCMDPSGGSLLEISSGSGQHISYFAAHFPNIEFQPTEINRRLFETINACTHNLSNVLPAKYLDVSSDPSVWLGGQLMNTQYDYILNINTLHVSNFKCTEGLFRGSCCALKPKGKIFMYGPFTDKCKLTPRRKFEFDRNLKIRNANWGLRDITHQLIPNAFMYGFTLTENVKTYNPHETPSDNNFLVWSKTI